MTPHENYHSLMLTIRGRLDLIRQIKAAKADDFARAETAAFHGRKIVEGTAFACLIALENGLSFVPKDATGNWSAEDIFKSLTKKRLDVLPSPSLIRESTSEEKKESGSKLTIEGVAEKGLSHDELVSIYQRLHRWAHELNPYSHGEHDGFYEKHGAALWEDLDRLEGFLERHVISIHGKGFFCVLRDSQDGQTKVISLEKLSA